MRRPLQLLALLLAFSSAGVFNTGTDLGCTEETGDCSDCPAQCRCACCPLPAQLVPPSIPLADQAPERVEPGHRNAGLVLAALTADIFHPPRA